MPLSDLAKNGFLRSSSGPVREPDYQELSLAEIFGGKGEYPGMFAIIRKFMDVRSYSEHERHSFGHILDFVMARCRGEVPTGAAFIRHYVQNHPLYRKDSIISPLLYQALVTQVLKLNDDTVPQQCCPCEKRTNSLSDEQEGCLQKFKNLLEKEDNDLFMDLEDPEGSSKGVSFSPVQTHEQQSQPEPKESPSPEEKKESVGGSPV